MEKSDKSQTEYSFKYFLRVRPQRNGKMELQEYYKPKDAKVMHVDIPKDTESFKNGRLEGDFEYEHILLPDSQQVDVFDVTAKALLDCFLEGKNILIMVYGITGSGKTFTMLGPEENRGLIPRSLEYIINGMNSPAFKNRFENGIDTYSLEMSYIEDYQDKIYDLLSPLSRFGNSTKPSLNLSLQDNGWNYIKNLTEIPIKTIQDGLNIIKQGTSEKHVAETKLNMDSSRSHTICTLSLIRTRNLQKEVVAFCRFVDLAGSERASRTNATGEQIKEAGSINKDLAELMTVLASLKEKKIDVYKSHYRNCKLTQILSSSFYGNFAGPVHMIVNISNDKIDFDETFYVLDRVTMIKSIKSVSKKIDNTPPPLRTNGGRKKELFTSNHDGADYERLLRMYKEKEKQYNELTKKYDLDIQMAIEQTESEARTKIVKEIMNRRMAGENDDSVINTQLESMRKQYAIIEQQLKEYYESKEKDLSTQIQDLCKQINDVEDENRRLALMLSSITDNETGNPATSEEIIENCESLIQENQRKDKLIQDLSYQLKMKNETDEKVEKQELEEKVEKQENELKEVRNELKRVREEKDHLQGEIKRLEEENSALRHTLQSPKQSLAWDGTSTSIKHRDSPPPIPRSNPPPLPVTGNSAYNNNSLPKPFTGISGNSLSRSFSGLNTNSLTSPLNTMKVDPMKPLTRNYAEVPGKQASPPPSLVRQPSTQSPPALPKQSPPPALPKQSPPPALPKQSPPPALPKQSPPPSLPKQSPPPLLRPDSPTASRNLPYTPARAPVSSPRGSPRMSPQGSPRMTPSKPMTVPGALSNSGYRPATSVSAMNGSRSKPVSQLPPIHQPATSRGGIKNNIKIEIASPNSEKSKNNNFPFSNV